MSLILPIDGRFVEPSPPSLFAFEAQNRMRYPVRPEKRGKHTYWYMRKKIAGKVHNLYIAPIGKLSSEMLNNATVAIQHRAKLYAESQNGVQS